MMWLVVALLAIACSLLICYLKWHFGHWSRKNFPYIEAKIPFGVLDSVRRRERSLGMAIYDVYRNSQEKVVGIYLMLRPALLVRDPQLVRDILVKDFSSFHDRGIYVDIKRNPLSGDIFALRGKQWKTLRMKMMPSFTTGKLKAMFSITEEIGNNMVAYLNAQIPEEGSRQIETKKLFQTFAVDIIASTIFGLDVNSFEQPQNHFNAISGKINQPNFSGIVRSNTQFLYPKLESLIFALFGEEPTRADIRKLVRETIEYREQHNIVRKDMLQMLLQLRNTGKVNESDDIWDAESQPGADKYMSIEMLAAQLFLFYVAGYETTASTTAFTVYEFAQYPEILAKANEDVAQAIQKHGKITYEALSDMKYLDLCLMETIRKYPGLPILNRECTEDYLIPGTNKLIEKGTPIVISLFGIEHDAEYFPDPEGYHPERFLEENMNYNPLAYLPFGEGPRHCIAQRMGKLNVKLALAKILTNFTIELNKQRSEIEFATHGVPLLAKAGINVRFSKRKEQQQQ